MWRTSWGASTLTSRSPRTWSSDSGGGRRRRGREECCCCSESEKTCEEEEEQRRGRGNRRLMLEELHLLRTHRVTVSCTSPSCSRIRRAAVRVAVIGCCPLWKGWRPQWGVRGSGRRWACQPICHWLCGVRRRGLTHAWTSEEKSYGLWFHQKQFWYQVESSHLTWRAAVGVQRSAIGEVCRATVHIVGVWDVGGGLRLLEG